MPLNRRICWNREGFKIFPFDKSFHGVDGFKIKVTAKSFERAAGDEVEHHVFPRVRVFALEGIVTYEDFFMDRKLILPVKGMQLFPKADKFCNLRRGKGYRDIRI